MKKILFFTLLLISFAACQKENPTPDDIEKPIGEMSIKSINGYKCIGDSLGNCPKNVGYFFADNELHIYGANFGDEDGEVSTEHSQIKLSVLSWDDNELVINTDLDNWVTEVKEPLSISIKRFDGKTVTTEKLNMVNDIENFPQYSPTWFLYSILQGRATVLPNDFYLNMDECDGSYEPELHDVLLLQNGKYGIITTSPTSTANGFYREWTFQISYMDCNGNEIEEIGKFKVVSDVVTQTSQTPVKYFKV